MTKLHLLVLLFIIPSVIFAQEFDNNRIIVFGGAELFVPADNATFTFEADGEGSTLSQAVDRARQKVKIISESLFNVGLKEKNLRTSFFHSGENFGNKAFLSSKKDFKATITVVVNINNLNLLEEAIIKVSEAKPERISNINFSLRDYEQFKMNAIEKAILKAKEKSNILVSKMDIKLGDVLFIEEIQDKPVTIRGGRTEPNPFNVAYEIDGLMKSKIQSSSGFYAQQVKIVAKVKAIFEIQGNIE